MANKTLENDNINKKNDSNTWEEQVRASNRLIRMQRQSLKERLDDADLVDPTMISKKVYTKEERRIRLRREVNLTIQKLKSMLRI